MARVTHRRSVGRGSLDIIIRLKSAHMFRLYHLRHFNSYSSLHPFVKCYIFINILANGGSCWEDSFTDLYLIWCNKLADRFASYGSNWPTSALDHLWACAFKLLSTRGDRDRHRVLLKNTFCISLNLASWNSIYRVIHWMTGLLDISSPVHCSLTAHLFLLLHSLTLWGSFVFHIDRIVWCTAIPFLAKFVFASHAVKLLILCTVLILHELPSFDVSIHLLHPPRLNTLLPQLTLALSLLTIMRGKIFVQSIERARCKVRWLWVWMIQLSIVHKFMVASDILSSPQIVQVWLIVSSSHVCCHLKLRINITMSFKKFIANFAPYCFLPAGLWFEEPCCVQNLVCSLARCWLRASSSAAHSVASLGHLSWD